MTDDLAEKLANLPTSPGVYQHKDAEGKVLYVGKAKNLRSRVRSYFQEGRPREAKTEALVRKIADVEVIVTDTEVESLLLEDNLIKKIKPRYNVLLKDDKSYPYICIKKERFPRVFPTRTVRRDGSLYFGPYTDARAMKLVLKTIKDLFKLRSCALHLNQAAIEAGKYQPCLDYHIQKCAAPCVGYETEAHYDSTIRQITALLNGKTSELEALLTGEMQRLATEKQFEEAAEVRDRLKALRTYSQKQKVVTDPEVDRDLFAIALDREVDAGVGVLFKVREGKIIGREHKIVRGIEGAEDGEILQRIVEGYYANAAFLPNEVFLASELSDASVVEALLREKKGRKVEVRTPQRGEKVDLMNMVEANARLLLGEWQLQQEQREEERIPRSVLSLQRDLRLKNPPRRIECFDISHLGGTGTVASCVVFQDGKPRKSDYRTYKIRTVENGKPDDFQSMREVVERRYSRLLEENGPWPDLVIIDGGKGQLSSSVESLRRVDVYGKFPVVGLAKRLEEVFFPGQSDSVIIPRTSSSLRLIQRVRDEAHRFAVTAQRKQRRIKDLRSELLDIPGVGAKTAKKLLTELGSAKAVRAATEAEIAAVTGPSVAAKIRAHYDDGSPEASGGK
ncbi:excinuclease ABC subunit C [Rubrivirga sp. SAORIC476]|uniref:excinuclease ABC subunit UvrC n=1 Tax=Rubrivirga sp. SAORIC476 TaxID=1961794 RepID=UPI000BA9B867|nr:excinuclease ABC subunit UvrC [Rubrivirga sp. SAORIC476]PAP82302.1 excinuclease ABC subunit C [Rubrivirga sp. SAORIC476]